MKRSRVLHVIESASGGSLQYVITICNALDPAAWDVTVLYSRRIDTPDHLADLFAPHITLIEIPMKREIAPRTDLRAALALRKALRRLQPDLVHLHSSKAGVLGRIAALGLQMPVLYTPHGFSFFRQDVSKRKRNLYVFIEKVIAFLTPFSFFLVGSEEEWRQAIRLSSNRRVRLLRNAVDVPMQPFSVVEKNGCDIVTVGRITAAKDPFQMLEIAEHLARLCPQARLVWIGDGEDRARLEREAARRELPLIVTGWLAKEEVLARLRMARAYVQASRWEGLPFALLEAMAQALPVVVSDIVAHRDVIQDGWNGRIAKSAHEFAEVLKEWLSHPDEAASFGAAAWQSVRNDYSQDWFVREIVRLYQQFRKKGE